MNPTRKRRLIIVLLVAAAATVAVALIVIALVGGVSALGGSVAGKWNSVSNKVAAVTPS